MREFKRRILLVMVFATTFQSVPLQGTNKILVLNFPLETGASTDFNDTCAIGNTSEVQMKEVTVNKREYQSLSFTSDQWNRHPFLDIEKIVMMKVEKLVANVLGDIFSVIKAADYNGATIAAVAASAFDLYEVLAMRRIWNESHWTEIGRSIVLDSGHVENLLKEPRLGNQNAGSTAPVRDGRFGGRITGFEPFEVPNLPDNGEKLVGMALIPSAMAVAFSPIQPTPAVRAALQEYSIVTDPNSRMSLEYRVWGDPDTDKQKEIIECNYGFEKLETAALKRIVEP